METSGLSGINEHNSAVIGEFLFYHKCLFLPLTNTCIEKFVEFFPLVACRVYRPVSKIVGLFTVKVTEMSSFRIVYFSFACNASVSSSLVQKNSGGRADLYRMTILIGRLRVALMKSSLLSSYNSMNPMSACLRIRIWIALWLVWVL